MFRPIALLLIAIALLFPRWTWAQSAGPMGTLVVKSDDGAANDIVVDGQPTGKRTPATLALPVGSHVIRVVKGCNLADQVVEVVEGQSQNLSVTLAPSGGLLQISSNVPGTVFFIDHLEVGRDSYLDVVSCGSHTVEARAPDHLPDVKTVEVALGGAYELSFYLLREAYGSLLVTTDPADAIISLDGQRVGVGRHNEPRLLSGAHEVVAELSGYTPARQAFTLDKEEDELILLTLTPIQTPMVGQPAPPEPIPAVRSRRPLLVGGLGVVAVGFGGVAAARYAQARSVYTGAHADLVASCDGAPLDDPCRSAVESSYANEVRPAYVQSLALGGMAAVTLVGTGVVLVAGDGLSLQVSGRF